MGNNNLYKTLVELYNHNNKSEAASFLIEFEGETRTCRVGKRWHRVLKRWVYTVSETYAPCLMYSEEELIGALAGVSGIRLHFRSASYTVSEIEKTENK